MNIKYIHMSELCDRANVCDRYGSGFESHHVLRTTNTTLSVYITSGFDQF